MQKMYAQTFGPVARFEFSASIIGNPIMLTSCYLINGTLIDTGQAHARKIVKKLVQHLEINQVVLTHYHEDHSGNAAAIKRIKQVPVFGHQLTAKKLKNGFGIRPYQYIMWGKSEPVKLFPIPKIIDCGDFVLETIHTPGHSADHLSFYVAKEGWLFSGDLFLSSRIRYFRSDEDIVDTITSLKRALSLDFESLFCTHNPVPEKGKRMLNSKLNYLEDLYGEIGDMAGAGYEHSEIIKYFKKSEAHRIKIFTLGDVSFENIVKSALKNIA